MESESSTRASSSPAETFGFDLMASTLAHEIRNPLQAMRLQIDSAIRGSSASDAIVQISRSLDRLERVMNRVQKLSEKYRLDLKTVNLRDLVENSVSSSRLWLQASGIELRIRVQWEGSPVCELDAELFEQVLLNLVSNATQAMPRGGLLNIDILECEQYAEIRVCDSGEGIDSEVLRLIGTPFYTTKSNGSGIGLAFCKTIVSMHKGSLEIESEKGRGTSVILRLPKAH